MQGFEAYLELRNTERETRESHVCDECGTKTDVDLFAEDLETHEHIYMCAKCVGKEEMAGHINQGFEVDCLVLFDGQKTSNCLPWGWFTRNAYGTLLKDGRVLWGDREVKPETYERV